MALIGGDILTNRRLDFDDVNNRRYEFEALAVDQGEPGLTSTASIKIQLVDINDNAPIFTEPVYYGNVDENAETGTTVIMKRYIETTDADAGRNADVFYTLTGNYSDQFHIDANTGIITTTNDDATAILDREEISLYHLVVTAHDGAHNSTVPINITVNDVNDNAPLFEEAVYHFNVSEDATVGTTVGLVVAQDMDTGINSRLTYFLVGGSDGKFAVDPVSGAVFVLSHLDRDTTGSYTIILSVTDGGDDIFSDFTEADIQILDVNDNAPTFDSDNYLADVEEELPSGTYVFTVTATDPDAGSNGDVMYSLNTDDFVVNQTT
ncbi:protocadherin-11 X-linked-like, partial [Saccoglossus kowalevskii]|uniref:Protocadherin-like wing polarity protein stan-like n=1 Tax=Saccoglossus kowalevskii TaxID=10224 RepID=A0ABM0MYH3_SACKO